MARFAQSTDQKVSKAFMSVRHFHLKKQKNKTNHCLLHCRIIILSRVNTDCENTLHFYTCCKASHPKTLPPAWPDVPAQVTALLTAVCDHQTVSCFITEEVLHHGTMAMYRCGVKVQAARSCRWDGACNQQSEWTCVCYVVSQTTEAKVENSEPHVWARWCINLWTISLHSHSAGSIKLLLDTSLRQTRISCNHGEAFIKSTLTF